MPVPTPKSIFLWIAAACLGLAVVAGVLQWRESSVVIAGSAVRFSFLNDMTWDAASGQLIRTGGDPHGWIQLQNSTLPIRRVTVEFSGNVNPTEGHFYFFQSVTTPVHLGLKMVEANVTVLPGGLSVAAQLDNSQCLRIDLPDFLVQPIQLRHLVLEKPFFDAGSWKFLTMVGASLAACSALGAMIGHAYLRRRGIGKALFWIFVFSAVLRIGLATVNREAGDDHLKVCRIILEEWRLPGTAEDWEGFQPKLYHATVAVVSRLLLQHPSTTGLLLTGQALSCLAGLATLALIYLFLWQLPVSDRTRLWCFAFTAFNPKLISIHAQATNDSFVIFFGALAIYATLRYLKTGAWRDWGWLTVALCLGALAKASGLVLVAVLPGVIVLDLGWRIWRQTLDAPKIAAATLAKRLLVLGFVFVILVPIPGQYFQRYRESGTPFATNIPVQPLPHWSERTYVLRPGIISLRDGFLSFPLRSLLEFPMVTNHGAWASDQIIFPGEIYANATGPQAYPLHMTSFWAQLYGGALFAHFDHWPTSWQTTDPLLLALGRILLLVGLLPGIIWLIGLAPRRVGAITPSGPTWPMAHAEYLLSVICVAAFLSFAAFYAVRIRDYSVMKAIFLFPAWLGFLTVFSYGLERIQRFGQAPLLHRLIDTSLGLVCLLGLLDVIHLCHQLALATTGV